MLFDRKNVLVHRYTRQVKVSLGKSYLYSSVVLHAAKGLYYIKLKFQCNSKSIRKRKRLDFLTVKLLCPMRVCV